MSKVKEISTGYEPRPLQQKIHSLLRRFNVIVCHRRFGKTVLSINEMVDRGLRNTLKNPQYAYIAPTYGQAKRVAWDYLKEYTKLIPGVTVNEAELRVDIPRPAQGDRIRFYLLGAENPGTLRGIYLDGALLDEYAEMDPTIWSQVLRPALSDRLGWVIFIGTPKGMNHFYEIYNTAKTNTDWFTAVYKASETAIIPRTELEMARATMAEEEYEQEFECSFSAALVGAYYGKAMSDVDKEQRITGVAYDPSLPVVTAWDLGVDDSTAIWFAQIAGREIHIIDYLENAGEGLDWYAKELGKKKYHYAKHLLPHDAAAKELGTGKTREETLRSLGLRKTEIVPRQSVEDGINASRLLIAKCWFDNVKCERGINALKNYERKWDTKNKIYQSKPLHNWASHGADAFRTLAMGLNERSDATNARDTRRYPRAADDSFSVI